GYLGTSDRFDKALVNFAVDYADQDTRDFEAWLKAIREGSVKTLKAVAKKAAKKEKAKKSPHKAKKKAAAKKKGKKKPKKKT
ncbi:MAG: DUF2252 family protein, partial [Candidatus Korobacteraceae bacterium]